MMGLATFILFITLLSLTVQTGMSNLRALLTALQMYEPPISRSLHPN